VSVVRGRKGAEGTRGASKDGRVIDFRRGDDFAGQTRTQEPVEDFDAEAIFAGHGIVAPEYAWDDYKGADVKGKVVVVFTNEPPSDDPKFFRGKELTYYGLVLPLRRSGTPRGEGRPHHSHERNRRLPLLGGPPARRRANHPHARQPRPGLRRLAIATSGRETAGHGRQKRG